MKITMSELHELRDSNSEVLDELIEVGRWHVLHRLVFKKDGKLWECYYREPTNDEWDKEDLDCEEVIETRETKTVYKKFKGPEWKELGDLSPGSWFRYDECLYQVFKTDRAAEIEVYSINRSFLRYFSRKLHVVPVVVEIKILEKIDVDN